MPVVRAVRMPLTVGSAGVVGGVLFNGQDRCVLIDVVSIAVLERSPTAGTLVMFPLACGVAGGGGLRYKHPRVDGMCRRGYHPFAIFAEFGLCLGSLLAVGRVSGQIGLVPAGGALIPMAAAVRFPRGEISVGHWFSRGRAVGTLLPVLLSIILIRAVCEIMSLQVAVRLAAHFALGFLRTAGRAAAVGFLCVSGIAVGALLPVLLAIVLIRAVCEIMSFQVAVRLAAHFALGFLRTAGRAAAVGFLCVSGIAVGALLPVLLAIVLIRAVCEIVSFQAAVFLAAHATLSLFRTAGRAAAVVYLCVGGIAVGTLLPVLLTIVPIRAVCEIMSFQVAVRLAAHFALGFLRATGLAASVVYLRVDGIAVGALLPVLLSIILIRAVCEIMSLQAAVFLAAHAALGFRRTTGRAAAVGFLFVNGIAAGALHPVIVLAVLPYRKIMA